MNTDQQRLDFLESLFTGKFRNSLVLRNSFGGDDLTLDMKIGGIIRGATVRELLDAAMAQKEKTK